MPPQESPCQVDMVPITFLERFPAQMLVVADNPVAQDFIERCPWTDLQVVQKWQCLLNSSQDIIAAAIRDHQENLVEKLNKAYLALK